MMPQFSIATIQYSFVLISCASRCLCCHSHKASLSFAAAFNMTMLYKPWTKESAYQEKGRGRKIDKPILKNKQHLRDHCYWLAYERSLCYAHGREWRWVFWLPATMMGNRWAFSDEDWVSRGSVTKLFGFRLPQLCKWWTWSLIRKVSDLGLQFEIFCLRYWYLKEMECLTWA